MPDADSVGSTQDPVVLRVEATQTLHPLPSCLPFFIEPQWKSFIVLLCLCGLPFLSDCCPQALPVSSHMLGGLQPSFNSSPSGVVYYKVTFKFWGFPCLCQETGPVLSIFLVFIPPCQTKHKKLWGLNMSVSLYQLWIWIRESLSWRGLHAQTICFPLVII